MRIRYFLVLIAVLGSTCTTETEQLVFYEFPNPAASPSAQPWIATGDDGALYLSWIESDKDGLHNLLFSSFKNASWTEPELIASGNNWFVNWADLPGILPLTGDEFVAWYLVKNSANVYGYDIFMRIRNSQGEWSNPFSPHDDGTPTQHGFASMAPIQQNILSAWLDGRETSATEHQSSLGHDHEEEAAMTLRAAITNRDGLILDAHLIDGFVCSCCPTSITKTSEGWLLAYRNRTKDEIRDIYLARFDGESWSDPYPLHNDGWLMRGCPVNGPSVASFNEMISAGWYTAADNVHSVRIAFSSDGGKSFDPLIIVDEALPMGRVSVIMPDERHAIMSWIGTQNEQQVLKAARISTNGDVTYFNSLVLESPAARMTPKMILSGKKTFLTWVEYDKKTGANRVKTATLSLEN